jgi:hypothetical protein
MRGSRLLLRLGLDALRKAADDGPSPGAPDIDAPTRPVQMELADAPHELDLPYAALIAE